MVSLADADERESAGPTRLGRAGAGRGRSVEARPSRGRENWSGVIICMMVPRAAPQTVSVESDQRHQCQGEWRRSGAMPEQGEE